MKWFTTLFLLLAIIGFADEKKIEAIINDGDYKKWNRISPDKYQPHKWILMLCKLPSENIQKTGETHGYGFIDTYINDKGLKAIKDRTFKYPPGTIIVKDKIGKKTRAVMVKGKKGTSPKSNDWEFLYFTKDKTSRGMKELSSCYDCHSAKTSRDYTFLNFIKAERIKNIIPEDNKELQK